MRACFKLAQKGQGAVSPNPLVGAVLVRNDRIVSTGYHSYFGGPHAEAECLRSYRGNTSGSTMYINLEPCTHYGKTAPCVDLIIQRGIGKVIIGMKDPNSLVAGKGVAKLRRSGVEVTVGVLESEAMALNKFFIKHIKTGIPYVHMKIAQTEDGFISKGAGPLRYITSVESRRMVHQWRAEYDAVLVGAGTILADDPRLDVRLALGRDPAIVILDGRLSVPPKARVFSTACRRRVIVCTGLAKKTQERKRRLLLRQGIEILEFPANNGRFDLNAVLQKLYLQNIGSILVEGGKSVFTQFVDQNHIDELSIFTSPRRFGTGIKVMPVGSNLNVMIERNNLISSRAGADVLLTGRVH